RTCCSRPGANRRRLRRASPPRRRATESMAAGACRQRTPTVPEPARTWARAGSCTLNNNKSTMMKPTTPRLCLLSTAVVACLPHLSQAGEGGFIEDASASLTARTYYFSRDFSDIVGPSRQSKAEERAQCSILNFRSGYSPGTLGFCVDSIGLLGIKPDSSLDRAGTGLLPPRESGRAADDYSRLGLAAKMRVSKTELKVGELQPNLPVLTYSDIRLLPPTYQGLSLVSNEFAGLTLQGGHLNSTSLRNEAGDDKMLAMLGHLPQRAASSDAFNYAGADYAFNEARTSVGLWYAQLQDIYAQRLVSFKHSQPLGAWTLGANLGFYDSSDSGQGRLGAIDN